MGSPKDGDHHLEGMAPYETTSNKESPLVVHKRTNRSTAAPSAAASPVEAHANGNPKKDEETSLSGSSGSKSCSSPEKKARERACVNDERPRETRPSRWTWLGYILIAIISKVTLPDNLRPTSPSLAHVWYFGWVTAISTGLGAAPLFFVRDSGKKVLAVGNAIAAGMMLSASYSLVEEGAGVQEEAGGVAGSWVGTGVLSPPWVRVALGALAGLLFIISTKKILDEYEDIKLGGLHGIDAKKVLLIVFVMTLHSFSEGVGIGVSFGGAGGARLGFLISATLAVHNVPEGLAVALVLHPRGVSKLNTALWCVFTSLPQPLMAVPAFLFVGHFMPFLPVGLGFAAGAMFWVACFELFVEAAEDSSKIAAFLTTTVSFLVMLCVHRFLGGDGL